MIPRDKYFDLLFENLYANDLLLIKNQADWRYDFQKYFEDAEIDTDIISKMQTQYGIGLQNVFLINCKKSTLLCDFFHEERNKVLIQTSVYFTVLGCLLDYLLDYGDAAQKAEALQKLNWDYFSNYFNEDMDLKDYSVIDLLYKKVSAGIKTISTYNIERAEYIIQLIKKAAEAEKHVNREIGIEEIDKEAVLNKSVIFVKISVEILLCYKKKVQKSDRRLIEELGYVFALIDDLCDLYEDMENGQMNLLMVYLQELGDSEKAETVIKKLISELLGKISFLKENFNSKLYEFILEEIREWSMSNAELRSRMWSLS